MSKYALFQRQKKEFLFLLKQKTKHNKKRKHNKTKPRRTNKEGVGAEWGRALGNLTWPLNPVSQIKKHKTKKQNKKKQNKPKTKENN